MLELRAGLPPELRARLSGLAAEHFGRQRAMVAAQAVVASFRPMGAEFDPGPIEADFTRHGHPIALPVTPPKGQPLLFRRWSPGQRLIRHRFGMLEPPPECPEVRPDVLLVPLLAFDRTGYRLGYGGGYYDRTLAHLRSTGPVLAIGVGFAEQEVDAVPFDAYDQRLDAVVTPAGVIMCSPLDD